MRSLLWLMSPAFKISRLTDALAAVANVWFVILWTNAHPAEELSRTSASFREGPLAWLLLAGAANALGLYIFGAGLHDLATRRRDRAVAPDRPIGLEPAPAEYLAMGLSAALIVAVAGGSAFGTWGVLITLGVASAALLFGVLGSFVPAIGVTLLGVIYAGHMLTPNPGLVFLVPVWWVMTHALVVAGLAHALGRRSPPLSRRAVLFAGGGWLVVSAGLGVLSMARSGTLWPAHVSVWAWAPVVGGAGVFVALVSRRARQVGLGPRLGEKIGRYGSLWLPVYACAWLLGDSSYGALWVMMGLTAMAVIGTTAVREAHALMDNRVGYRR